MGHAVESKLMIGHEHLDCGMSNMDKICEPISDSETRFDKQSCCENEYLNIEVKDEFKSSIYQNSLNFNFVTAFVVSYVNLFSSDQEKPQISFSDPPLVTRDILTLNQVFLI